MRVTRFEISMEFVVQVSGDFIDERVDSFFIVEHHFDWREASENIVIV